MNMIEQYITAVAAYLPEERRVEVAQELRNKIVGMLPEQPTDADVRAALQELGHPRRVADTYELRQRYLIGPDYYDSYLALLKLVVMILIFVMAGITLLTWIVNPPAGGVVKFMIDLFGGIISGAVNAAAWVTVIFVILERTQVPIPSPFDKGQWKVEELLKDSSFIPRSDSVAAIFFTVVFTALLYFRPNFIAFFSRGADGWESLPILDLEVLASYMPLIILLGVFEIALSIWKFVTRHWTLPLALANAVHNVASLILALVLLWDRRILNANFSTRVAAVTNFSARSISRSLEIGVWIIIALIVLAFIGDSIATFAKVSRTHRRRLG